MKAKTKITQEDFLLMERKARRDANIEFQVPHVGHRVHKSKKSYNRQKSKKIDY